MVLFGRLLIDKRILNEVIFHYIQWETSKRGRLWSIAWALKKRDWWKSRFEETAKFFRFLWKEQSGEFTRTGLYIGRLAIVYQTKEKGEGKK